MTGLLGEESDPGRITSPCFALWLPLCLSVPKWLSPPLPCLCQPSHKPGVQLGLGCRSWPLLGPEALPSKSWDLSKLYLPWKTASPGFHSSLKLCKAINRAPRPGEFAKEWKSKDSFQWTTEKCSYLKTFPRNGIEAKLIKMTIIYLCWFLKERKIGCKGWHTFEKVNFFKGKFFGVKYIYTCI